MDQSLNKAKIGDMAWVYTKSVATDVSKTWAKHGFIKPSESLTNRYKWHEIKNSSYINEEKSL